ncbi:hypothetical protein E1B28_012480 [Marasmius oreades]|uniref:Uncharacterized protein n=1 Tax=Marasmius oreades TaxID=181124 RepID=A0A9P7RS73_9AGAR|nr:uncharacterized protein E1B28_012480 [Marasmius oreades]KAG7088492.1 hypothetical protein E1B28_012480 [Marasmius oreades]
MVSSNRMLNRYPSCNAPTNKIPDHPHFDESLCCLYNIMFLQEIQDNSGPTDDGEVSANLTLTALVEAIAKAGGVSYNFTEIPPVDGQDGGQPGGNIRTAYLYRPEKLRLVQDAPVGGPIDSVEVVDRDGKVSLRPN